MTTNTPNKYTVWNQAVEAVEIYLASNPRELTEDQLQQTFKYIFSCMMDDAELGDKSDPAHIQELVEFSVNRQLTKNKVL